MGILTDEHLPIVQHVPEIRYSSADELVALER